MNPQDEIVAIALLTRRDVDALGSALKTVFLVDQKPVFLELLHALDEAKDQATLGDERAFFTSAPADSR